MHANIYVNLPIKNLPRSRSFFAQLGYTFNKQYSNDQAGCMVLGENLFVMLLEEPFFQLFTTKRVADATQTTEVLVCLSCRSREEVDNLVGRARSAGAVIARAPQDHGFMYSHGFEDLDGHIWELVFMDPTARRP